MSFMGVWIFSGIANRNKQKHQCICLRLFNGVETFGLRLMRKYSKTQCSLLFLILYILKKSEMLAAMNQKRR